MARLGFIAGKALRQRGVRPVQLRSQAQSKARRVEHAGVALDRAACFNHSDSDGCIGGEAVGEDQTRRSTADDDEVEGVVESGAGWW